MNLWFPHARIAEAFTLGNIEYAFQDAFAFLILLSGGKYTLIGHSRSRIPCVKSNTSLSQKEGFKVWWALFPNPWLISGVFGVGDDLVLKKASAPQSHLGIRQLKWIYIFNSQWSGSISAVKRFSQCWKYWRRSLDALVYVHKRQDVSWNCH